MKSDFNDENLNYLSEAVSNIVSDDSDSETSNNKLSDHMNSIYQSPSYLLLKENYSKMKISKNDDINSLRYKLQEMNKIMEHNSRLAYQKELKIKELEDMNQNSKKFIQNKFTKYEKLKKEYKLKAAKIIELENENNTLKFEFMKFHEETKYKDNSVSEIQNIIKITTTKFRAYEEKNQNLKEENERIKRELADLKNQNNNLTFQNENNANKHFIELKSIKQNFELAIIDLKQENAKKEESLKLKFEENEKTYKAKMIKREEELKSEFINEITKMSSDLEATRLENEKLKVDYNYIQDTLEDYQNSINEKTIEFKKNIESKDKSYEKLYRSLKDVKKETKEIENKYNIKSDEWHMRQKLNDENEEKLKNELIKRDKLICENENEIYKYKQLIDDYESNIKEFNIKIENKENVIEELKNQNNEIINEFNKKISEFEQFQKDKVVENEEAINHLKQQYDEKKLSEVEELCRELDNSKNKIKELNDYIDEKNKGLEEITSKEKNYRENLERNNKVIENLKQLLLKKLREIEERYQYEIQHLNNNLKNCEMEINSRKEKYDKKIQKFKNRIEEETLIKENLMKEVKMLMENKLNFGDRIPIQLKNENLNQKYDSYKPLKINNNFDANQLLETLKEINFKIDEKI